MIDKKYYICHYCHEEFIPKRRHVQKFCSNSCRSKAHHIKNRSVVIAATIPATVPATIQKKKKKKKKKKPDTMSLAGVGNATGGTLLADTITKLLTSEENKPATKGDLQALAKTADIQALLNKMGRYHKVANMQQNFEGKWPYFDMETKTFVYLNF